jgi:metallophosphoesterase (TIGR00282 family)
MKALFLGDVCGRPGCRAVFMGLRQLIREFSVDFVIANGENATDGFGISGEDADMLFSSGVDVITSGNHIWQKEDMRSRLDEDRRILRPANYPHGVPGHGSVTVEVGDLKVAVVNLQGRMNLPMIDCPFTAGKELVSSLKRTTPIVFVDMHAEAPEEKEALSLYLDGSVSAFVGTHTHVQTADERILPGGTGYITDLGMTGAARSVIGSSPELSIRRQLTQMPIKSEIADEAAMINGLLVTVDTTTGTCLSLSRVDRRYGL